MTQVHHLAAKGPSRFGRKINAFGYMHDVQARLSFQLVDPLSSPDRHEKHSLIPAGASRIWDWPSRVRKLVRVTVARKDCACRGV